MRTGWLAVAGVLLGAVLPLNRQVVFALNPPISLGDVIRTPHGEAYVLDVALEGARVRVLEGSWPRPWERDDEDRVLALADLDRYPRVSAAAPQPPYAVGTESWDWHEAVAFEPYESYSRTAQDLGVGLNDLAARGTHAPDLPPGEIDELLRSEARERHTERVRRTRSFSAATTVPLVGSVLGLAAGAAQVGSSGATSTVIAVSVAVLGVVTAIMVAIAEMLRRREARAQETPVAEPLTPGLEILGRTIDVQRWIVRDELGHAADLVPQTGWDPPETGGHG